MLQYKIVNYAKDGARARCSIREELYGSYKNLTKAPFECFCYASRSENVEISVLRRRYILSTTLIRRTAVFRFSLQLFSLQQRNARVVGRLTGLHALQVG